MISPEEKARIARENGSKSQGPTSAEGKERVSQNATRHGFFAKRILIPGESAEIYGRLTDAYLQLLAPQTLVELDLVTDIINSRWLIRRAEQLTTTAFWAAQDKLTAESDSHNTGQSPDRLQYACFQQAIEGKNYLEILSTMKEKHERGYHRALARLERLRKKREPLPAVSPSEVERDIPENAQSKQPEPQPGTSPVTKVAAAVVAIFFLLLTQSQPLDAQPISRNIEIKQTNRHPIFTNNSPPQHCASRNSALCRIAPEALRNRSPAMISAATW